MKKLLSYILFLISLISVHGQVNLQVIPNNRDLRTDEQLKLTVILEIKGDEDAQQSPLKLPDTSKFLTVGNASYRRTYLNVETQKVDNQFFYQIVLQPKQTGRIKIGSVLVTVNDKIYKTEPFDVFVTQGPKKEVTKHNLKEDMHLDLEVKDKDVYKNQPTIAVLKVYSKDFDNFRNISDIKFPQNKNIDVQPISFTKSDIEQDPKSNISSQVIGIFLISSTESGEIEIPPVTAKVKNSVSKATLKSNNVKLKVKKLPLDAPRNYKNAVGNFKININSKENSENIVGQPLSVDIDISGEGNFGTMELPKLSESKDYSFFPPKITYNTKNTETGSAGSVNLKYIVIPKISGKIDIKVQDFAFFDPEKTTFENLKVDTLSIFALTTEQINDTKSTLEKVNDYTNKVIANVSAPQLLSNPLKTVKSNKIDYKIVVLNLILLVGLIFLISSYKTKKRKKLKLKNKPKPISENIAETEQRLKNEEKLDLETELSYLEKLKNNKDFGAFFSAYESFQQALDENYKRQNQVSFKTYLQQNKGEKIAEDFRNLNQEFSIEKYAPMHSEENIDELFKKLKNLISQIK